jgi:putative hydrolase of the HAD superfamily
MIRKKQEQSPDFLVQEFYHHQANVTAGLLRAPVDHTKEKIERLMYRGWEPIFKTIKPFPYAVKTLAALGKAGYKIGLLSDFPPEIKLEHMGLSGFWDAVLCSERFGAIKPHPRPFLELAGALSLPPEKILYVGNSFQYDVAGAHRAGMKTAWIKGPFARKGKNQSEPDFTFSDYRQLYDFMLN